MGSGIPWLDGLEGYPASNPGRRYGSCYGRISHTEKDGRARLFFPAVPGRAKRRRGCRRKCTLHG